MRTRDTVIYTSGLLAQQILAFTIAVFVARGLGPKAFGTFSVIRNISSFLLIIAPLGLDLGMLKHGALNASFGPAFEGLKIRIRLFVLGVNLVFAALTFTYLGGLLQNLYNINDFWLLANVSVVGIVFAADIQISGALFRVHHRLSTYAIVVMLVQPLARLFATFVAINSGAGLLGVVSMSTMLYMVTFVVLQFFEPVRFPALSRLTCAYRASISVAAVLTESIWMSLSMLAYQATRFLDVIFIGALVNVASAGEYSAISSVCQIIQVYPLAVSQMLGPSIASSFHAGRLGDVTLQLRNYTRTASILGGFIFAGVAVYGPNLDLFFGKGFHFSPTISLTLATSCFINAVVSPLGYALSMTGRHKLEFSTLLTGSVMLVIMLAILVPLLGQYGAAVSVLFTAVFTGLIRCRLVASMLGEMPIRWRSLAPPIVFLLIAYLTNTGLLLEFSRNLIVTFLGCCLYTVIVFIVYTFFLCSNNERLRLKKLIGMNCIQAAAFVGHQS